MSLRPRRRHVGRLSQLWTPLYAAAYGPSGAFRSCGRCRTQPPTARRAPFAAVDAAERCCLRPVG